MICRFGIAIPAYNNPKTIVTVVQACLRETDYPIIIVDDGSDQPVETLFSEKNDRLNFIRFSKNQGKGKALQAAFQKALSQELTHIITVDADGQHRAEDIKLLVAATEKKPWALIIGERQMEKAEAPKSSIIGRAISNFWIQYETEKPVTDSQSGFRLYPLFHFQTMNFVSSRYEFEIETLTRAMWSDVEVVSVLIPVIYQKGTERVTHFNKIKDNARMIVLNAALVITSLLRRHDSPLKSAVASAVGVFIGCLPIWGLHTGLAFVTSVVFRINFLYMWVGTNISAPPFIPFLFYSAKKLSNTEHLPDTTSRLEMLEHWGVGFLLTGLILGTITGIIVFTIKYLLQQKRKNKVAVRTRFTRSMNVLSWIQRKFGLKTLYFFMYPISFGFWMLSLPARKASMEYWKIVQPNAGLLKRQILFYRQLLIFSKTLCDRAYQKLFSEMKFEIIKGEGADHFLKIIEHDKKGLITLQNHIGGWEIAMSYFAKLDMPKKMIAIRWGDVDSYQHTSMNKENKKLQVISFNLQKDSLIKLKGYLDEGHAAGMMGDRAVGRNYEVVPFFGKLAVFDTTAVRIAKACQVDLYIVFSFKEKNNNYVFSAHSVPTNLTGVEFAKYYSAILEKELVKYPQQWFNFYPFWSKALVSNPEFTRNNVPV